MKGVKLATSRARRLALAVLAGVLFGLVGSSIASADAQPASPDVVASASSGSDLSPSQMGPMVDWWL